MADARPVCEEDYESVRALLLETASLYPGIDGWCRHKVLPDLRVGKRIGLVIDDHGSLGGLLIAKRGSRAKLCALRVREGLRGQGWGKELMGRAAELLRREGTSQIHMTVSEALGERHKQFFWEMGVQLSGRLKDKYVRGVDELVCTWSGQAIDAFLATDWRRVAGQKSNARGTARLPHLVMSLKPEFARLFLEGRKTVEFRRRFSDKHVGSRVLFYVSSPARSFQFTATIAEVCKAPTSRLWEEHRKAGGVDSATFQAYFEGTPQGYAIHLTDVRPLHSELRLTDAVSECPGFNPPQSYRRLRHTDALAGVLLPHL